MRGKNNILAIVMLLSIALTSIGLVGGLESDTKVLIEPTVVTVNPGETFKVNVEVEKVTDLYAFEFKIGFVSGTKIIGAIGAEGDRQQPPYYPYFLYGPEGVGFSYFIEPIKGYIHVGSTILGDFNGLSGSGTLAKVEFVSVEAGESDLHLYDVVLLDHNLNPMGCATRDSYVDGVNAELVMINIGARTKDVGDTQQFDVKVNHEDPKGTPLNVRARIDNVRDDGYTMTMWAGQSYVFPPIRDPEYIYCDGFDATASQWTAYGASPYLDAPDDGNYIEGTFDGAWQRWFTFEDIALEGAIVDYVNLEAYTDGPYETDVDFDAFDMQDTNWFGSLYATGTGPTWVTCRWIGSLTTSDILPYLLDEEGINNFGVGLNYFDPNGHGGAGRTIDSLRLHVVFKAGRAPEYPAADGFDATASQWTAYGASPYLDAPDDGNYIEGTFDGAWQRWFTFEDVALEGAVVDYVQLWAYTDGPYEEDVDFDIFDAQDTNWFGSLYATGAGPEWVTPRWVGSLTTSDILPYLLDEEGINNFAVGLNYYDPNGHGGAGRIVDALKLEIVFKAERVVLPRDPPEFVIQPGEVRYLDTTIWGLEPEDAGSYECTITVQYSAFGARFNEATKHVITESWRCRPPE